MSKAAVPLVMPLGRCLGSKERERAEDSKSQIGERALKGGRQEKAQVGLL